LGGLGIGFALGLFFRGVPGFRGLTERIRKGIGFSNILGVLAIILFVGVLVVYSNQTECQRKIAKDYIAGLKAINAVALLESEATEEAIRSLASNDAQAQKEALARYSIAADREQAARELVEASDVDVC
jgi:hypothetical protein